MYFWIAIWPKILSIQPTWTPILAAKAVTSATFERTYEGISGIICFSTFWIDSKSPLMMIPHNVGQSIEHSQKISPSKVNSSTKKGFASSETFARPSKNGCFSHFNGDSGNRGCFVFNLS